MNTEKLMPLSEAIENLKKYKLCIDTALAIGHGTAQSAEVSESIAVVLDYLDEMLHELAEFTS